MAGYKYTDERRQHLHSFDDKPLIGISTASKMAGGDKPGLIWWAAGCAVALFGWLKKFDRRKNTAEECAAQDELRFKAATEALERIKAMDVDEYQSLLDSAYKAHSDTKNKKAKEGTQRHAKLEEYVHACMDQNEGAPLQLGFWQDGYWAPEVEAFIMWACGGIDRPQQVKRFLWCEVNCYNLELWTGGIADIGYEDMAGRIVAGDHKSSKESYFDQFIQIAGYDLNLSANGGFTAGGEKVFELPKPIDYYVVFPFGSTPFVPDFEYDVEGYREGFKSSLALHKLKTRFDEERGRVY